MDEQEFDRIERLIREYHLKTLQAVEASAGEANRVSKENRTSIDKILHLMNGNGDVKAGIVYKVEQLFDWMPQHIQEHKEKTEANHAVAREKSDRWWVVYSGIIKWIIPFIVYGLAIGLAELVDKFGL